MWEWYVYAVSALVYIGLYLNLFNHPKWRLLNDFVFIGFVSLGQSPYSVLNFIYIILPIINSINFSGEKKSPLPYLYASTIIAINIWIYEKGNVEWISRKILSLAWPLAILWAVNSYTYLRQKVRSFKDDLDSTVDDYLLKQDVYKKPYKIYDLIIERLNRLWKKEIINGIFCFKVNRSRAGEEKLVIVNGTEFIWTFEIEDSDLIEKLRKKKFVFDSKIELDLRESRFNYWIYIEIQGHEYIYVFEFSRFHFYSRLIGFFQLLTPVLVKISRILLNEKNLIDLKNENTRKLSQKIQYVGRANNTMHFIRNRLSPFSNLISMIGNYDKTADDKKEELKALLIKESKRAENELNNITERANQMLEKSSNPFVFTDLEEISLEKLFGVLKQHCLSILDYNLEVTEALDKKRILKINESGFELFLSDWLNNVKKYQKDFFSCGFILDEDTLQINFTNDHSNSKDIVKKLVSDLNSNDRSEILKRKTYGISNIKSTLEDMEIKYEGIYEEKLGHVSLNLSLTTSEYEDNSI